MSPSSHGFFSAEEMHRITTANIRWPAVRLSSAEPLTVIGQDLFGIRDQSAEGHARNSACVTLGGSESHGGGAGLRLRAHSFLSLTRSRVPLKMRKLLLQAPF